MLNANNIAFISRTLAIIFAYATILFGASAIYGWYAKILPLIKYQHDTISMVFNTACSFCGVGLAVLLIIYKRYIMSNILSLLVLVVSVLSLLQHVFSINLHIDQLLFNHWEFDQNMYPGRMAPNTALCFIMSSWTLLICTTRKYHAGVMVIAGMLAFLTLCMGIAFTSGYYSELQNAYLWTTITPMAKNTAIVFVISSLSIIFLTFYISSVGRLEVLKFAPYIVSINIFVVSCMISLAVYNHHTRIDTASLASVIFIIGGIFTLIIGLLISIIIKYLFALQKISATFELLKIAFEAAVSGIVVVDIFGKIVNYNKQFLKIWDISIKQIRSNNATLYELMAKQVADQKHFSAILGKWQQSDNFINDEVILANGNVVEVSTRPQKLDDTTESGRVWTYHDITVRKNLEKQLLRLSTYDSITSLPNKSLIIELLTHTLETAKNNNSMVAVFLLDIDNFAKINDLFGHSRGDLLLKAIALRIHSALKNAEVVGRMSGDEFLVVAPIFNDEKEVLSIAYRINDVFKKPFELRSHNITISACIGITVYPKDGMDVEELLSKSDISVIKAKNEGRNTFKFYSEEFNRYTMLSIDLENDLHQAVINNQFVLHYQPIINLYNGKPIGVEALIRWQHPTRGMIQPLDFIPLAENLGVINKIGAWVLSNACLQMKQWQRERIKDIKLSVNINVSAKQFQFGEILVDVDKALQLTGLEPKLLNLELTEGVLFGGGVDMDQTLSALNKLGVSISIDDFGSGYSSFAYLRKFRISMLKIDKSFIDQITRNNLDKTIVTAIIGLGRNLEQLVLAEGIETEAQLKILQEMGCDLGQGYYFAKPMPADVCLEYLRKFS